MTWLRTMLFGTVALAGASLGFSAPASADPDLGFYIGPNGARIYYDNDGYRYGYRPYARSCHNEVWYSWRFGERVRVVDRVCYRFGRRYIADRDYYPTYGYSYDYDY